MSGKLAAVFCALYGHSHIIEMSFGYVYCSRCDAQIGDTLASTYKDPLAVVIGHDCADCRANYKALGFKDKFMTPNPFKVKEYH